MAHYVWTALAAFQAALWFFALPALVKPHWEAVWSGMHPLVAQLIMNLVGLIYITTYTVVMLPIYAGNYAFFEQYKISDKVWAWQSAKKEEREIFWALSARSGKLFAINYFILIPCLTVGKYFMMGNSMSFSASDWPSYRQLAFDNAALTLVHEFFFYWSHRMMHLPQLYKYHKVHHEYKQNTVLASQHNHPIDWIMSIGTPALLALVIVDPHSISLFQRIPWVIIANLDDHCGYEFPWSPVRWFYLAARTDQHDFHHSRNMGCFSSKLGIYDALFGSDQHYLRWRSSKGKN